MIRPAELSIMCSAIFFYSRQFAVFYLSLPNYLSENSEVFQFDICVFDHVFLYLVALFETIYRFIDQQRISRNP